MADTTLLLNGFSIIGDPHTNTNAKAGGNLLVHGGEATFEANDIVVFTVTNVTADGTLTADSIITGVIVYENATDYYYDTPKYTYSGSADIDFGRNNMGDRYLQFDAGGLTSTDAGAPVLNELALVAGVDILGTLASNNGPMVIPTNETIDLNGDGIITANELGDASFSSDLNVLTVVCFARGTLIETPTGPRYIESLRAGDIVNTLDQGPQQIRWAGSRVVPGQGRTAPVHIAAGALGNIRPLIVSQNHRMLVRGAMAELLFGEDRVLVAAKHLVNDHTIRVMPCSRISYHHILFDAHQIVFAEGCPAESLFPGEQALEAVAPEDRDEIVALLPERFDGTDNADVAHYVLRGFEAATLRRRA